MEKVDRLDLLPAFGDRKGDFITVLEALHLWFFSKPHHGCPENRQM